MLNGNHIVDLIFISLRNMKDNHGRILEVTQTGDAKKSEIVLKTLDDGREQSWIIKSDQILEYHPDGPIELSVPDFDPLPLKDIQEKGPRFWMQVFNGALRDSSSAKKLNKIHLIKSFRCITGDGLKESKDAIDGACMIKIFTGIKDPLNNFYEYYVVGELLQQWINRDDKK